MEWGESLTRGLAQLAVICYLLRVLLDLWGSPARAVACWKRGAWTAGCAALWLHVAAAFHFIHQWSHAEAIRQTAEQTRQLTGWAWGGGVYINHAFALLWLMDVVGWWRGGLEFDTRSSVRFWMIHAIFAFMMFNATVVFGPVHWRYIGLAFAGLLIAVWFIRPWFMKM